jgi:hypothetical protein
MRPGVNGPPVTTIGGRMGTRWWEAVGVNRFERSEQLREAMWQRCWIVVQVETSVDDQERPGKSERRGTGTEDTSVLFSRSIHTSNN